MNRGKFDENVISQEINEFNGYSQNEIKKIESNKIKVANSKEDIKHFVDITSKLPGTLKLYVSKIKDNIAQQINEKIGLNVKNYNISLKTDAIRHSLKNHTNKIKEELRGQIPLTTEDFENIPEIINNFDNVENAGETEQGKPVIKFEKNIDGNTVVLTYVSDKHKNLELQTMYKFKNDKKIDSVTALNEIKTLSRTSETDSDTNLNNIIPQNENNMQIQLKINGMLLFT